MATPQSLPSGTLIAGRYRVDAEIGRGGFGAVLAATQLPIGRAVAVKVLLPEMALGEHKERFRREAALAQRLEHPNTVRLLDFGVTDDGLPFLVFELLKGKPLDAVLRETGALHPLRVARIASQVLKSLMEAHALGVVHRDIKPANVFLCTFQGEPDFVKVLDFGIAKEQGQDALTQAGQVLGTPSYMAPEQMMGRPVTPLADLYTLGLVMAEALTGAVVFQGENDAEVCVAQLSDAPAPLPPAVLRSPLGPVILRATQKLPERRFASAGEMLAQLDEAVRKEAKSAEPASSAPSASSRKMGAMETRVAPAPPLVATPAPGSLPAFDPARAQLTPMPAGQHAPPPQPPLPPTSAPSGPVAGAPAPAVPGYGVPPVVGYAPPPGAGYPPPPSPMGGHPAPAAVVPMPARPMPVPPRGPKTKSMSAGQGCLLAGGVGIVALLAVGALGALAVSGRLGGLLEADAGPTAVDAGPTERPDAPLRDLGAAGLRQRIERAGYTILGTSRSEQDALGVDQLTVKKGNRAGSVSLYRFNDATIAKATEDALRRTKDAAVARDGDALLFVLIPGSAATSRELSDSIVKTGR
jgi:serine/threonine-protein kinase